MNLTDMEIKVMEEITKDMVKLGILNKEWRVPK